MTDMGRCRDCKHYRGDFGEDLYGFTGVCSLLSDGWCKKQLAYTELDFSVTPDFGCVQFEKREDSNGD